MRIEYRRDLNKLLHAFRLPMRAAELGVAEGYFSADMLKWGLDHLYCVDAYEHLADTKGDGNQPQSWHDANRSMAMRRMADYDGEGKVTWLRGKTWEMAPQVPDKSLGLLYLDGDHSYAAVMKDLKAWFPKVAAGGVIAGHDYLMPQYGVRKAVLEFAKSEVFIIQEDKAEDAGFWFQKNFLA